MRFRVEPVDGHELDRLITALLNATGVVHQVINAEDRPGDDGVEVIGRVAARLREPLAMLAEHHGDEGLAEVTGTLGAATLLVANELGLEGLFEAG